VIVVQIHQVVQARVHRLGPEEAEMLQDDINYVTLLRLYEKNSLSSWYFAIIGYNRVRIVPLFSCHTSVGRS